MHHSEQNFCVPSGALWAMGLVHCRICEMIIFWSAGREAIGCNPVSSDWLAGRCRHPYMPWQAHQPPRGPGTVAATVQGQNHHCPVQVSYCLFHRMYTRFGLLSFVLSDAIANCYGITLTHDDVINWKHFLRYWSFVRGIHRSHANSQRPVTRSFDVSFDLRLNKPPSKQSRGWWFGLNIFLFHNQRTALRLYQLLIWDAIALIMMKKVLLKFIALIYFDIRMEANGWELSNQHCCCCRCWYQNKQHINIAAINRKKVCSVKWFRNDCC